MGSNAQTILDDLLGHERSTRAASLSDSDFFEFFTAEQILKNYGLSYEEIQAGMVDYRGGDGGIDSIYTFVNGVLATEDADFDNIKQNVLISLLIIQSKTTPGFSDEAILRFESTAKDLLDLGHGLDNFRKTYNSGLLRAVEIFRSAYRALLPASPELHISFYYVTKGDYVHPNVQGKADGLKSTVKRLFSESTIDVHFYGAEKLLGLHRKSKVETLPLVVAEAMPTRSMGNVCLVSLKDFHEFIHDCETGELRGWLFEENVRDYEGKNVDVNKAIRQTLETPVEDQDFWWLNNGITIVATRAPMAGKTLTITDPKIVNGLQTSMEIYNYFRLHPEAKAQDSRSILVRAIVTMNDETRNDIIRATNSQSAIRAASLRAFDPIHYKIEEYFALHGLYYERRKNYYKNQGKPKDKIVSISYLAQAVAAIILQRPNDSRGRPINLIKNEKLYHHVFDEQYPVELFLQCILFMKNVDEYLSSDEIPEFVRGHEVNVRYQLAMFASAVKARQLHVTPRFIQKRGLGLPNKELLEKSLDQVWRILQTFRGHRKDVDEDKIAKSTEFDLALKKRLAEIGKRRKFGL